MKRFYSLAIALLTMFLSSAPNTALASATSSIRVRLSFLLSYYVVYLRNKNEFHYLTNYALHNH